MSLQGYTSLSELTPELLEILAGPEALQEERDREASFGYTIDRKRRIGTGANWGRHLAGKTGWAYTEEMSLATSFRLWAAGDPPELYYDVTFYGPSASERVRAQITAYKEKREMLALIEERPAKTKKGGRL